jgi:maltose O-acetyltransferase
MRRFWFLLYLLFFKNTPEDYRPYALFFPWIRRVLVGLYLKDCGVNPRVKSGAEISPNATVGDNSELGTRCLIQGNVHIGSDVIMGPDVKIYSRNHRFDSIDIPIRKQGKIYLETIIGNDVWLGANVIVTAGCKIGDHSVVAAGAVVTSDIEPFSVVGGVPAKLIRTR